MPRTCGRRWSPASWTAPLHKADRGLHWASTCPRGREYHTCCWSLGYTTDLGRGCTPRCSLQLSVQGSHRTDLLGTPDTQTTTRRWPGTCRPSTGCLWVTLTLQGTRALAPRHMGRRRPRWWQELHCTGPQHKWCTHQVWTTALGHTAGRHRPPHRCTWMAGSRHTACLRQPQSLLVVGAQTCPPCTAHHAARLPQHHSQICACAGTKQQTTSRTLTSTTSREGRGGTARHSNHCMQVFRQ
jgi:hypothetical protein